MKHFALALSLSLFAMPLAAQDVGAQIADQLRQQGYSDIEITKTWLGRLRFQARSDGQNREIIANPRTGEILRDFQTQANGRAAGDVQILNRAARVPGAPNNPDAPDARRGDRTAPTEGRDVGGVRGSNAGGGVDGPARPGDGPGDGPGNGPGGASGPSK